MRPPATSGSHTGGVDLLRYPPRVAQANCYPFERGESVGPHYSESELFLLVTDGAGRIRVDARWFELRAGQVLHVPWETPVLYEADQATPFALIGLHFDYRAWDAPAVGRPRHLVGEARLAHGRPRGAGARQWFPEAFVVTPPDASAFELAMALVAAFESASRGNNRRNSVAFLRGQAITFLAEVVSFAARSSQTSGGRHATAQQLRIVREVTSFLELNLAHPHNRATLARRANLSQSSLAEAFRRVTGRGPIDHLIELRLDQAKRLLRSGRTRVGEIAARVGIPDVFHFSKIFKKRVGCSPLDYRRRLRI